MPDPWFLGTVEGIHVETARAKTFTLRLPAPLGHRAGQHVVVRLTAPDGYTATRSYSVASAPSVEPTIDLTVERLADGIAEAAAAADEGALARPDRRGQVVGHDATGGPASR